MSSTKGLSQRVRESFTKTARVVWRVLRSVDREFNNAPSHWIREPEPGKPTVVFVHGFLSSGKKVWLGTKGNSWVELLATDESFSGWGIVVANWYTTILSERRTVIEEAESLFMELRGTLGGGVVPLDSRRIVFVAHSMGGIVVRQMLISHPEIFSATCVDCVTLSTPAHGADMAEAMARVSHLANHAQALTLLPGSDELIQIDDAFTKLVSAHPGQLRGIELVEEYLVAPKHAVVEEVYRIGVRPKSLVTTQDQGGYFGAPVVIPGTDHISIARPHSRRHGAYRVVKAFMVREG